MTNVCPACGSDQLLENNVTRRYAPPFGQHVEYSVPMLTCGACTESFEREGAAEAVHTARDSVDKRSVITMLDFLASRQTSGPYIERVLRLPPCTVTRWRSGDVTASELALIRMIRARPWLLGLAAAEFQTPDAEGRQAVPKPSLMTTDDWDMELQALCEQLGNAYVKLTEQEQYGSAGDVEDAREQRLLALKRLLHHAHAKPSST